jgi:hypothetical protein
MTQLRHQYSVLLRCMTRYALEVVLDFSRRGSRSRGKNPVRRREFITLLSSAVAAWPPAAFAQPREPKRRVAVLMGGLMAGDPGGQAEAAALQDGLTERGWKPGGNIELKYYWPGAELDQVTVAANENAAMRPDLVVSRSTPATATTRAINRVTPGEPTHRCRTA